MKSIIRLTCLSSLLLSLGASATAVAAPTEPRVTVVAQEESHVDLHVELGRVNTFAAIDDYVRVEIDGAATLQRVGLPAVPVLARYLALPDGTRIESVEIRHRQTDRLHIGAIVPTQPTRVRQGSAPPFVVDESAYRSKDAWPVTDWADGEAAKIRDQTVARLELHPVRYFAATGEIEVDRSFDVRVYLADDGPSADRIRRVPSFERVYARHLVGHRAATTRGPAVGETLLVLVGDGFDEAIAEFVTWKRRRGLNTITTAVPVGSTADDVADLIQTAYDEDPTLTHVLLVGDEQTIPTNVITANQDLDGVGESDYNYSKLEGDDNLGDVFIGRFSGRKATHIQTMAARVIAYEREVGRDGDDGWTSGAIGIGSSEGQPSDTERVRQIMNTLREYGYDKIDEYYQADNPNPADVVSKLNEGRGWVYYMGHGSGVSWDIGNFHFQLGHVEDLINEHAWPVVIDCACSNGDFVNTEPSFTEAWLRSGTPSAPTGAVAMISSTILAAWHEPAVMEIEIGNTFIKDRAAVLGEAMMGGLLGMQESFGKTSTVLLSQDTFVNFGDPSTVVRSKPGTALTVTHEAAIDEMAAGTLTATVLATEDESPVAEAVVALSRDGELVEAKLTDDTGIVTFDVTGEDGASYDVVVTGFDLVSDEQTIDWRIPEPEDTNTGGGGDDDKDGCGCASTPARGSLLSLVALGLGLGLGWRRRRRLAS